MEVQLIDSDVTPARTVCLAARGDYYSNWVMDDSFQGVMSSIEGDDIQQKKENLIEDLYTKGHHGPFEHPHISFAVKEASRPCMSQFRTHRHMSFDVQSQRYVDFSGDVEDIVKVPKTLREDAQNREQGYTELDARVRENLRTRYLSNCGESINLYESLVADGVPKEDARFCLPMGTMCNFTVSGNARSWMHIFDMRRNAAAQWEIRELNDMILDECLEWFPELFELYEEKGPNKLAP